jgi:hypothetical protein
MMIDADEKALMKNYKGCLTYSTNEIAEEFAPNQRFLR